MKSRYLLLINLLFFFLNGNSQFDRTHAGLELMSGYAGSETVPFWMRSNQYGSVPVKGISTSLTGLINQEYDTTGSRLFDVGYSFEGRLNVGSQTEFIPVEAIAKARLGIFQLKAGRSKQIMGLCDEELSSGAWAISGNALGVPMIEGSIPEYYSIPWFGKMFAFKGQFAHGWLGLQVMKSGSGFDSDTIENQTYFHQKSFYGRLGKPEWKLKLYGGFNHQVFWGNEDVYYEGNFTLSDLETLYYVTRGKVYNSSKVGNHLGSIDLGGDVKLGSYKFNVYHQFFYDVGNLYHLTNIRDGITGLSITNSETAQGAFHLKKILLEFMYSKSQGGQPDAKPTPTPYEHYYNNHQYIQGWSYNKVALGNPFFTIQDQLEEGLPYYSGTYFANNRIILYHLGLVGSALNWDVILKASYSLNYGTYYTTDEPQSTEINNPGTVGLFGTQKEFSMYLDAMRPVFGGKYRAGFLLAFDAGSLLRDSFGCMVRVERGLF